MKRWMFGVVAGSALFVGASTGTAARAENILYDGTGGTSPGCVYVQVPQYAVYDFGGYTYYVLTGYISYWYCGG